MGPRAARVAFVLVVVTAACGACGSRYYSSDAPDAALPDGGADDASPAEGGGVDSSSSDSGSDAGSDADAGADAARVFTGCNGALACTRTVFVTSAVYPGNLGGLEGGDAKCQARADTSTLAAVHDKRFLAWLADGTQGPTDRFPHGTGTYQRSDGTQVANGWSDLVDGTLNFPIDRDENGIQLAGASLPYVWTASDVAGNAAPSFHCEKWTTSLSGSELGAIGKHAASDATWTSFANTTCDVNASLYCFEY